MSTVSTVVCRSGPVGPAGGTVGMGRSGGRVAATGPSRVTRAGEGMMGWEAQWHNAYTFNDRK